MLPALLPVGAAIGGLFGGGGKAIGDAVRDFSRVGQNKFEATPYKAEAAQFGGVPGGAQHFSQMALDGRDNAMNQANYSQGQMRADRGPQAQENVALANREAQARGFQQDSLGLARNAAMGNAPSVAARQMQAGMDAAVAGQQSQLASARGGAGMALAAGNAGANVANIQNQTFSQAAQLRAQEMATARGQYQQGADAFRAGDQNRLQMGNQMSQFNANANDQYRLGMGQLGIGYQGAAQGWQAAATDPWKQQQQADMQASQINADSYNNAQAINAGVAQAKADQQNQMKQQWIGLGTGLVKTGAGMASGGSSGSGGGK